MTGEHSRGLGLVRFLCQVIIETKPEGRVGVTQVKSKGEAFQADEPAFAEAVRCKSTQRLQGQCGAQRQGARQAQDGLRPDGSSLLQTLACHVKGRCFPLQPLKRFKQGTDVSGFEH